jgi:hypothetical protein
MATQGVIRSKPDASKEHDKEAFLSATIIKSATSLVTPGLVRAFPLTRRAVVMGISQVAGCIALLLLLRDSYITGVVAT